MGRTLIPGFRFSEGRLLVFTEEEVKIIHAWPDLEAVRKPVAGRTWKPFVPCFRLLRPRAGAGSSVTGDSFGPANLRSRALDPDWEKHAAFGGFRHSIPAEIAAAVEGFTSRQWALLAMCRRRRLTRESHLESEVELTGASRGLERAVNAKPRPPQHRCGGWMPSCRDAKGGALADKHVGAPGQLASGFGCCKARRLMQTPSGKVTPGRSSKVLGGAI